MGIGNVTNSKAAQLLAESESATYFSAMDISFSSSSSLVLALDMLWADAMLTSSLVDAMLSLWVGDDRSSVLLLEPDLPT